MADLTNDLVKQWDEQMHAKWARESVAMQVQRTRQNEAEAKARGEANTKARSARYAAFQTQAAEADERAFYAYSRANDAEATALEQEAVRWATPSLSKRQEAAVTAYEAREEQAAFEAIGKAERIKESKARSKFSDKRLD